MLKKKITSALMAAIMAFSTFSGIVGAESDASALGFDANKSWKNKALVSYGTSGGLGDAARNFTMTNEYGKELSYTLVETCEDEESTYWILANDRYGAKAVGGSIIYDPTQEDTIAKYVNEAFVQETAWQWNLPEAMIEAIDYDHVWYTEKAYEGTLIPEAYTVTAGVVIPAVWELATYGDRVMIDFLPEYDENYMFRTPFNDGYYHAIEKNSNETIDSGVSRFQLEPVNVTYTTEKAIRPEFFLNKDFFKNAKINLATAGSMIKEEISKYSYTELSEIYTLNEIITYLPDVSVPDQVFDTNKCWNNKAFVAYGTSGGLGDASRNFTMTNEYGTELSYTLVETFNSKDAKYWILANDRYGTHAAGGSVKYDPTQENTLAKYVNEAFVQTGAWRWNLPKAMIDAIDYDHVWGTEKAYTGTLIPEAYTFTAGVTIPSIWEMERYGDRVMIELLPVYDANYMFRTAYGDSHYHALVKGSNETTEAGVSRFKLEPLNAIRNNVGDTAGIRPEFFLNEDFFKNAKINLATAGNMIKKEISKYSYVDLSKLYTDDEISTYLPDVIIPPFAPNKAWNNKAFVTYGTSDGLGDATRNFTMKNEYGRELSFTLVETYDKDDAKYWILANDRYGTHAAGGNVKYDPTQQDSIAKYVNEAFVQTGAWQWNLPKAMIDAIDYDHVWYTEKAYTGTLVPEAYTFTAGVVIPAIWEMEKFGDRVMIDILPVYDANYMFRTAYGDSHYHALLKGSKEITDAGVSRFRLEPSNASSGTKNIRPEFFLNKDFFKNAKIELATAGSLIKEEISKYSYEDLSKLYTDSEIYNYLGMNVPSDADVSVSWTDGENTLTTLVGVTTIVADVTIDSRTDEDTLTFVAAALYDKDKHLVDMSYEVINIASNESGKEVQITIDELSNITDDYTLKLFVWDKESLEPRADELTRNFFGNSETVVNDYSLNNALDEQLCYSTFESDNTKIKNIIFMIPDGGAMAPFYLADEVKQDGGFDKTKYPNATPVETGEMYIKDYLVGAETTYSANNSVTDSAAAGTALATGYKTNNGHIGIDPQANPHATLLEACQDMGKNTGMVVTKKWPDATPAAFSAHDISRENLMIISEQIINQGIDVVIGNNMSSYNEKEWFADEALSEQGYKVIKNKTALQNVKPGDKLFAKLPSAYFDVERAATTPNLAELTEAAITVLNDGNKNGFFLMVEGSAVDTGGHNNNACEMVSEYLAFDEACRVAIEFAKERTDTMVVIVPDHDTGGISYNYSDIDKIVDDIQVGTNSSYITWEIKGHTARNGGVFMYLPEGVAYPEGIDPAKASQVETDFYNAYGTFSADYPNDAVNVINNIDIPEYITSLIDVDLDDVTEKLFVDVTDMGKYDPSTEIFTFTDKDIIVKRNESSASIKGIPVDLEGEIALYIGGRFYVPQKLLTYEEEIDMVNGSYLKADYNTGKLTYSGNIGISGASVSAVVTKPYASWETAEKKDFLAINQTKADIYGGYSFDFLVDRMAGSYTIYTNFTGGADEPTSTSFALKSTIPALSVTKDGVDISDMGQLAPNDTLDITLSGFDLENEYPGVVMVGQYAGERLISAEYMTAEGGSVYFGDEIQKNVSVLQNADKIKIFYWNENTLMPLMGAYTIE